MSPQSRDEEEQGPVGHNKRLETVWTRAGGLRMHARASGSSELKSRVPVVLVHGLVVSSRYMVPTAERLATHHPVFAPDLPGFGRSENPTRVLDVSGLSDALSAWMGGIGLERALLIGNPFGCQIIADLAVRHPERIERAILQGPTMDPRGRSVPVWVARLSHPRAGLCTDR